MIRNVFFELQCNVSTCCCCYTESSCYSIKVGFYKQVLNISIISGCLYLVKAASTPLKKKKKRIITKNQVAHEEELSTHYNDKWKTWTKDTIREYYSDLRDVLGKDPTLQKARKMAEQYFNNNVDVDGPSFAKNFWQAGGGRQFKAQEQSLIGFLTYKNALKDGYSENVHCKMQRYL